ncbi:MAG TPA: S9 family peptidase, partial [Amycolatopsis sp.]|nr:S9 family peptidase [Amycolatopsis sp.]
MRPADIEALVVPGRPALRGNLLLTALKRPDLRTNAAHGAVRRVALDGGEAAWTHGPRDSAPAISPDGRWVALLRAGEGTGAEGSPQLHVMPADGGEARRLTSLPLGAGEPVWAPDSRRIAFTARVPEAGRYGTPDADGETPEPAAEAPRRITRLDYRIDDVGFLRDRMQRLFVVDTLEPGDPEPLTGDGFDAAHPVWTPDGTRVVFTAPPDWGVAETDARDICAIPAEGGEPEVVVRGEGLSERPAFGPDGTLFYFGQSFAEHHEAAPTGLYAATPAFGAGPVQARRLTDAETVDCEATAGPPAPRGADVLV